MLVAKSLFWEGDTRLPPHGLPEVCSDPEVVGEEPQLHLLSWQSLSMEMWWGWGEQDEDSIHSLGQGLKPETRTHSSQASKGLGGLDPSQCYQ